MRFCWSYSENSVSLSVCPVQTSRDDKDICSARSEFGNLCLRLMFYEMDILNLCIRTYKESGSFIHVLLGNSFRKSEDLTRQQFCCNNGKGKGVEIPSLITITMGKKYVIKKHCVYCCLELNFCFEEHEREIDRR